MCLVTSVTLSLMGSGVAQATWGCPFPGCHLPWRLSAQLRAHPQPLCQSPSRNSRSWPLRPAGLQMETALPVARCPLPVTSGWVHRRPLLPAPPTLPPPPATCDLALATIPLPTLRPRPDHSRLRNNTVPGQGRPRPGPIEDLLAAASGHLLSFTLPPPGWRPPWGHTVLGWGPCPPSCGKEYTAPLSILCCYLPAFLDFSFNLAKKIDSAFCKNPNGVPAQTQ